MKSIIAKLANNLISIKTYTLITVCMLFIGTLAYIFGEDKDFALIWVRMFFCLINFLIATAIITTQKRPLFLLCVYMGILCSFLYHFWNMCNYIWVGEIGVSHVISALTSISSYLFLFTASYGALDSLADDGTKKYRKYRIQAVLASIVVTVLWAVNLNGTNAASTVITGASLTILTYIVVKHIFIPDIENGFVVTLKSYYIVLLLLIISRLAEIMISDMENANTAISIIRFASTALVIWIFPLGYRGAKKWISI